GLGPGGEAHFVCSDTPTDAQCPAAVARAARVIERDDLVVTSVDPQLAQISRSPKTPRYEAADIRTSNRGQKFLTPERKKPRSPD
ncbi:hypothetical protein ABZ504_56095, partial [Streptomyces mirabilis]|uniref:hypothetical protein n=1 Tax=Streptomyces mirabilis TaxID=68239 RepID=UPI0033D4B5FA